MRETPRRLIVSGRMDLDTERGREVWRAPRSRSMGFRFGYLATASHDEGEVRVLDEIDLLEISIAPAPANPRTRMLAMKALEEMSDPRDCTTSLMGNSVRLPEPLI